MSEPLVIETNAGGDGRCPRVSEGAATPPGVLSRQKAGECKRYGFGVPRWHPADG